MTHRVSLQQEAVTAFASYLAEEFADDPDVVVEQRWPDVNRQRPKKTITVILAGARRLYEHEPYVVHRTNLSATRALYTWAMADMEHTLQMDVWCTREVDRDSLLARLDISLHKGEARTLPILRGDPVRHGVVVPLANGRTCDFLFSDPTLLLDADKHNTANYRATFMGRLQTTFVVEAESPRMATIIFKSAASDPSAETTTSLVAEVTASGSTIETG